MKRIFLSWLISLGLLLSFAASSHAYDVPNYDGFVNDFADILSPQTELGLETELKETAASTSGAEIAVVTIVSLKGDTIENVTQEFFDKWQVGKTGTDNGVILLIALEDRKIRIATGYGTEAIITDAEAGRIIRSQITPEFKAGNYEAGILNGVAAIQAQFGVEPAFSQSIDPLNKGGGLVDNFSKMMTFTTSLIIFGLFSSYLAAWLGRSKAWWLGGVVGGLLGLAFGSIVTAIFFAIVGFILDYFLSTNYQKLKKTGKSTGWTKTWGGFSSGSSGGRSSSSGGSFGGGSSGGGGASGGW